jgi:hypothetical protein
MEPTPHAPESPSPDDLVISIVEAVAETSDADPLTLPPLQRAVDTEALAALVESDGLWDLTFSYHDHVVTIDGDGHIEIAQRKPTASHAR